jgi:hypothetical protein
VNTKVGRLAGALLVETAERGEPAWFLVGETKVPCDWAAAGFAPPPERDLRQVRYVRLEVTGAPALAGRTLALELAGEAAARTLADRLLVARNGSVSERLWRLILGVEDDENEAGGERLDARWLGEVPARVWDVVKGAVLRCT